METAHDVLRRAAVRARHQQECNDDALDAGYAALMASMAERIDRALTQRSGVELETLDADGELARELGLDQPLARLSGVLVRRWATQPTDRAIERARADVEAVRQGRPEHFWAQD